MCWNYENWYGGFLQVQIVGVYCCRLEGYFGYKDDQMEVIL